LRFWPKDEKDDEPLLNVLRVSTLLEILARRVFGCCGFLSFSLVFCLLGGRLETTLYIHFTQRWVEARRRSSTPRKNEDEKKRKRTPFFAVLIADGVVGAPRLCRALGFASRCVVSVLVSAQTGSATT
jgi:hypothetical protein